VWNGAQRALLRHVLKYDVRVKTHAAVINHKCIQERDMYMEEDSCEPGEAVSGEQHITECNADVERRLCHERRESDSSGESRESGFLGVIEVNERTIPALMEKAEASAERLAWLLRLVCELEEWECERKEEIQAAFYQTMDGNGNRIMKRRFTKM